MSPITTLKNRGAQNPGARSPWQLNIVRWRLKFRCLQYVTCFMLTFWRLECWYGSRISGKRSAPLHKKTTEFVRLANDIKLRSFLAWSKIIVNIVTFWNSYRNKVNENPYTFTVVTYSFPKQWTEIRTNNTKNSSSRISKYASLAARFSWFLSER
jgi:hypothetical protein